MHSSKKITLMVFLLVTLLATIIVVFVAIGSRQTGYDGAKKRAYLTAEIVKNSLTSHMLNGTMDQRGIFLNSFSSLKNVQELWVIRSKSVGNQYGASELANEKPKDDIDKEVLETGKEKIIIHDSIYDASLRITIPYIASSLDKPNCLSCHNAQEGEVLGAISLQFDITEDRTSNIIVLLYIVGAIAIFLISSLIFIQKKIKPFANSLDEISRVLKQVHAGDYGARAQTGTLIEDKEAFLWLNELIEKLETVLTEIEKNLTSIVHNRVSNQDHDKLISAKKVIENMSEIYHYKKTIENDLSVENIYSRLVSVLENMLQIKHFCIFETDLLLDKRKTIFISPNTNISCNLLKKIKECCRAERLNNIISSENFPNICEASSSEKGSFFICIPFCINEQTNITIHILSKSQEELTHIKNQIGIIKKYLEETKPILETKLLMNALKTKNLTDALTGLYNRKYLDEIVDKELNIGIKNGEIFTVMFLDVDYFKMINDSYGHDIGDDVLKKLAITMKKAISENDTIIRYGGEEFLILMKKATEDKATKLAKKINKKFSEIIFNYGDSSFSKTVSIGYAFFPKDANQFYKCVKYADIALYEAKATGRNKIVRFSKEILKNGNKLDY